MVPRATAKLVQESSTKLANEQGHHLVPFLSFLAFFLRAFQHFGGLVLVFRSLGSVWKCCIPQIFGNFQRDTYINIHKPISLAIHPTLQRLRKPPKMDERDMVSLPLTSSFISPIKPYKTYQLTKCITNRPSFLPSFPFAETAPFQVGPCLWAAWRHPAAWMSDLSLGSQPNPGTSHESELVNRPTKMEYQWNIQGILWNS